MVRENTLVIDEALRKGINKSDADSRDLTFLNNAFGLVSTQNGLEKSKQVSHQNFPVTSAQLLTQNDFTTNPTSWTLGTGWAWDSSDNLVHTGGSSNTGLAQEDVYGIIDEQLYLCKIVVTGMPDDNVVRDADDVNINDQHWVRLRIGSATGPKVIRDGTYYFLIPGETDTNSRFRIEAFAYATVTVDEVELWTVLQTEDIWRPTKIIETSIFDLYVTNTTVSNLVKSDGLWTKRDFQLYDAYSPASTDTVLGSTCRHQVADFKNALFMTRGVTFMMYLPSEKQRFMLSKTTAPGAVANYKNRLVLGGLIGDPNQTTPSVDEYFDTDTDWSLSAGASIGSGKLTLTGTATTSASASYTGFTASVGSTYRIEFDVISATNVDGSFSGNYVTVLVETPHTTTAEEQTITEPGHYVLYSTAAGTGANPTISLVINSGTATLVIDNFKVTNVGWFGTDRWINLFNLWKEYSPTDIMTSELQYFDKHWVMWSNLGGGDVYWPFTEEMALLGMPDTTRFDLLQSHFEDSIKAQQIGFQEMPYKERVEGLYRVGDYILVFGGDGIALMTPASREEGFGFTVRKIINSGINCNISYAGTSEFCFFLDDNGVLWLFNADGSLQNIGYKNVFGATSGIFWNLLYDQATESLHLNPSSGTNYVLNRNGLSKFPYRFTSFIRRDGVLLTIPQYPSWYSDASVPPTVDPLNAAWTFTTNEIDFNVRAIKTIHSVQIDSSFMEGMTVQIDYRYDTSANWASTDPVLVNDTGVAVNIVSGVDFRITVSGYLSQTQTNNPVVRRLDVKWHLSDKRNVRGLINA